MKGGLILCAALALTACDYTEVEREIGYKGKARVNPWLAAERFVQREGLQVKSVISWTAPEWHEAVWVMPATILNNVSFTRRMEDWVSDGGHLILLVDHADAESNDWNSHYTEPVIEQALLDLLERAGLELMPGEESGTAVSADEIDWEGETFKVDAKSESSVAQGGDEAGVFGSAEFGAGRITVITDARIFRNRWIDQEDHAALLDSLIQSTGDGGTVGFMRGSGMSLWVLLRQYLWPVLVALGLWLLLWLWKNFSRFGPVEAEAVPPVSRGYEHHLEALGDFQWRLDRAASLLAPLREQIVELGQQMSVRAGRRDDDFFQFLADRAGLPRERVFRALAETAPADPAVLIRTTADLQKLLKTL